MFPVNILIKSFIILRLVFNLNFSLLIKIILITCLLRLDINFDDAAIDLRHVTSRVMLICF